MSASLSSEEIRNIFIGAVGQEGDAVMHEPGPAGLVMLLQPHFAEYEITVECIGETLRALSWAEDCSFTFDDFETFLKKYLTTEGADEVRAIGEDHDAARQLTPHADTIADGKERKDDVLVTEEEPEWNYLTDRSAD